MPTLTLDKQTYPMMMHLSILPKYDQSLEEVSYDASTQTSNIEAMATSWCTRSASSSEGSWPMHRSDNDQQEDD